MRRTINGYLTALSKEIVPTKGEKDRVRKSVSYIRRTVASEVRDVEETFVFGSFDRGTMIRQRFDPKADADLMIVFDRENKYTPQTYLTRLRKYILNDKFYKKSLSKQSSPAVVLQLNHIALELVPAYYNYNTLYIPDPSGSKSFFSSHWQRTDPQQAKDVLTDANVRGKSVIKPAIRLMKYWNALNGHVYKSYDLESRIVNQTYWSAPNLQRVVYGAVRGLRAYDLSQVKARKVDKLKEILGIVEDLERRGLNKEALSILKTVFPPTK